MIQATELRIGNIVTDEWYDSFKTLITVDSISSKGVDLYINDDGNWPECAQTWIDAQNTFESLFPIPLTEQYLIDFGFTRFIGWDDMVFWRKGTGDFFELAESEQGYRNGNDKVIPYVHLLQNAYFFDQLDGSELTLSK